ncbi:phage tail protein [Kitasatospora sp. CB01950]|uniref:phage tail protein n=1 Tax=Kitasatospora sp. CB01950 TaxID=1703930 RepID=UPI00093BF3DA|nr:phage tail protein [Kitasatospora sp. CB01950]OKJ05663.1 hypothetical protein AMK19_25590 [Kitasatospora sp. CB01950]
MAPTEFATSGHSVPNHWFRLDLGGHGRADGFFASALGLAFDAEDVRYRTPGRRRSATISLRQGVAPKDGPLFSWLHEASRNRVERKDCRVSLTDGSGETLLATWTITDAVPVRLGRRDVDDATGKGTIEDLMLATDRLAVEFH